MASLRQVARALLRGLAAWALPIGLVVVWQIAAMTGLLSARVLPAPSDGMGAEEGEERPEVMLDHQGMAVGTTGRREDDGAPGEHGRVDEVEEMLEETGIGGLVDRRRNDQHVGSLDRGQHALGAAGELAALDGGAEFGAGVDEIEELDLAKAARLAWPRIAPTSVRVRDGRVRLPLMPTIRRGMASSLGA